MVKIRKEVFQNEPYDSKETEQYFHEMQELMERDARFQNFSVPEEWDKDFRRTIRQTIQQRRRKTKAKKWVALAASVLFLLLVGMCWTKETVIAKCITGLFMTTVDTHHGMVELYSTDEDLTLQVDEKDPQIVYCEAQTLSEVFAAFRENARHPIFQLPDCLEVEEIKNAYYNNEFRAFVIEMKVQDGFIYLSQGELLDGGSKGLRYEKPYKIVWNDNLKREIYIKKGIQENTYTFSVANDYMIFCLNGFSSLEDCCVMAEHIFYE